MIGGRPFAALDDPAHQVGVVLEAGGFHGGRTARDHLRVLATEAGIAQRRVGEVLELVGLSEAADRRAGTFSLGMGQRLSLAAALLGDPAVLLLDEPANGLDPGGIHWLRGLLRGLAGEGRTVVLSSHVLAEVEQTVDEVLIFDRGRLLSHRAMSEIDVTGGGVSGADGPHGAAGMTALISAELLRLRRFARPRYVLLGVLAFVACAAAAPLIFARSGPPPDPAQTADSLRSLAFGAGDRRRRPRGEQRRRRVQGQVDRDRPT